MSTICRLLASLGRASKWACISNEKTRRCNMNAKIKKPTKAERLERERLERQAYFKEVEQRMNGTMKLLVSEISSRRPSVRHKP